MFIKVPLATVKERTRAPEAEYLLRVESFKQTVGKTSKKPMFVARIGFVEEDYLPFKHYISLPVSEELAAEIGVEADDENAIMNKWRGLKRFLVAFGVDFEEDGFDEESVAGSYSEDYLKVVVESGETDDGDVYENNRLYLPWLEE